MSGDPLPALELRRDHWQEMLTYILRNLPEEACGFVAGHPLQGSTGWRSASVMPLTNILHSPTRYRLDPREHLASFELIDMQGWELAAIFHSHPTGPNHPSATDLAESAYPDTVYLIWSIERKDWICRAFIIRERAYQEVGLTLV